MKDTRHFHLDRLDEIRRQFTNLLAELDKETRNFRNTIERHDAIERENLKTLRNQAGLGDE